MKNFSSRASVRPVVNQSENLDSRGGVYVFKIQCLSCRASLFSGFVNVGLTFADTIRLKDGSIIKGKIVNFGEGKFTDRYRRRRAPASDEFFCRRG